MGYEEKRTRLIDQVQKFDDINYELKEAQELIKNEKKNRELLIQSHEEKMK
jgi:hypothetical protein